MNDPGSLDCDLRWPQSAIWHWRKGYERLKAENASLMESLRESSEREKIHVAGVLAAHKEIVAAKQRAEAAEKERDEAAKVIAEQIGALRDAGSRMAELEMARRRAEKRSADLMGALRSIIIRCREGDKRTDWLPIIDGIARAALHDEERSAPPQREKP